MDSAALPGLPKSLTEVRDNREMRSEISDPEHLLRGSWLKINEEGSRLGNKKGGNDFTGSEGQEKGAGFETENQNGRGRLENLMRGSELEVPSWVDVAREKKVLKKYDLEIIEKDGQKVVEIPNDFICI
ncbi:hypothetical protein F2Q68_00039929 [Brassica cretica]|uniref:Uncharacterized protein n=1 Tax=Brassica cretica TaxID=69181 RepID=A0A8S9MRZ0_BRACR|nr:hypothetical protein F2Q68_00039929 [Brassica cretica]